MLTQAHTDSMSTFASTFAFTFVWTWNSLYRDNIFIKRSIPKVCFDHRGNNLWPKRLSLLEFETWHLKTLGHHGRFFCTPLNTFFLELSFIFSSINKLEALFQTAAVTLSYISTRLQGLLVYLLFNSILKIIVHLRML